MMYDNFFIGLGSLWIELLNKERGEQFQDLAGVEVEVCYYSNHNTERRFQDKITSTKNILEKHSNQEKLREDETDRSRNTAVVDGDERRIKVCRSTTSVWIRADSGPDSVVNITIYNTILHLSLHISFNSYSIYCRYVAYTGIFRQYCHRYVLIYPLVNFFNWPQTVQTTV